MDSQLRPLSPLPETNSDRIYCKAESCKKAMDDLMSEDSCRLLTDRQMRQHLQQSIFRASRTLYPLIFQELSSYSQPEKSCLITIPWVASFIISRGENSPPDCPALRCDCLQMLQKIECLLRKRRVRDRRWIRCNLDCTDKLLLH